MTAKNILVVFVLLVLVSIACKKETSCEGCRENNKPPIAIAGPDQVITLPTDSISLDGSASNDPDGTISEWLWTKISGPAFFNTINATTVKTVVKNLVAGDYQIELKVTDYNGLSARDTMSVIVDPILTTNHPPVANAGADQFVILPTNSVNLDGGGSTDPDNNITSYIWTKISGPSSFNIVNATAEQTQVTNLVGDVYQFELKVTDAGGLFAKDTVQITVNPLPPPSPTCDNSNRLQVNVELIPIGTLPQIRYGMGVASAGNKIFFAGGIINNQLSSRVDIYDIVTQAWSTAQLSEARYVVTAIAAGDKIFFAGGEVGDGTWPVRTVDIYNVTNGGWSTSQLSTAGHSITAAAVGDKVLFAGGDGGFTGPGRDTRVDIYNLTTNSWSPAQLSEPKHGPTAVTANNKIFFAGGYTHNNSIHFVSDKIDIYDNTTNTWSASSLNESRVGHGGIAVAEKIYWAGGSNSLITTTSCSVEIRDVNTGNTVIQFLSEPSAGPAVLKNSKIIFFTIGGINDNRFDIYDIASDSWSIGVLPQSIYEASIIAVNNTIYLTGGYVNGVLSNQVWKLEF